MPLQAASEEPVPDDLEVLAKLGTVTEEYGYEFVAFPSHHGLASLVYISGKEVAGR